MSTTKTRSTTPAETTRELSRGVNPQRTLRLSARAVVEAIEAGMLPATPQLAADLETHRRALRALRTTKAYVGARQTMPAAQAAVWARLQAGAELADVDLDELAAAKASDDASAVVTGTAEEWVLSTMHALEVQLIADVDVLIETGIGPLLRSVNRAWQPMLEALEDRDPRRPELFVALDDDAGRAAMHGARDVAKQLAIVRQAYRDLVTVRIGDARVVGDLDTLGLLDRPSGGRVEVLNPSTGRLQPGDELDRLIVAGVQPGWHPSVSDLEHAGAGWTQSPTDPGEIARRRAAYADANPAPVARHDGLQLSSTARPAAV